MARPSKRDTRQRRRPRATGPYRPGLNYRGIGMMARPSANMVPGLGQAIRALTRGSTTPSSAAPPVRMVGAAGIAADTTATIRANTEAYRAKRRKQDRKRVRAHAKTHRERRMIRGARTMRGAR